MFSLMYAFQINSRDEREWHLRNSIWLIGLRLDIISETEIHNRIIAGQEILFYVFVFEMKTESILVIRPLARE
jgi:hypothetical protein